MGPSILTWPILFGQVIEAEGEAGGMPMTLLLLSLAGMVALVLIVGLPIVLGIRSEQRKREMEHAERMRAIELGRPISDDDGWWTPSRTAAGIGVGVPIGVFGIGWVAAASTDAAAAFIWPSVGAVGVAAVICGTILAARLPSPRPPSTAPDPLAKPYVDPDAFDLAEHRHA